VVASQAAVAELEPASAPGGDLGDGPLDVGPVRAVVPAGYADQCWTLARIADQVWRRFGVEYTLAGKRPSGRKGPAGLLG
jgi:hypothetical protein